MLIKSGFMQKIKTLSKRMLLLSRMILTKKVSKNPMGGISVRLIINKDPNLYITCNLDKDNQGHLVSQSSHQSPQLTHLLESRGH